MSNNDVNALSYILKYCLQINETSIEFNSSKDRFNESATFRNAICLCLLQIGELVTILSDDFKDENPNMRWREIKLLRNIVAHRYGQIDYDNIWEICLTNIPEMIDFCNQKLSPNNTTGL
jgi:uncharacterized protein with HEPN domain